MRCLSPVSIKDPRSSDSRVRLTVPCNKCVACLSNRRNSWSFRLFQELKHSISAHFITLTYDDDHIPENGTLVKKHVQDWMKRLRKYIHPYKVRYFLVGEYGGRYHRPHYHCLLFNHPDEIDLRDSLEKSWTFGFCDIGTCTPASIHYVTKYTLASKLIEDEDLRLSSPVFNFDHPLDDSLLYPTFMVCSKRPGIGSGYLSDRLIKWHKKDVKTYVQLFSQKLLMPRYYRDKVFKDETSKHIIRNRSASANQDFELDYDRLYSSTDAINIASDLPSIATQNRLLTDKFIRRNIKLNKDKL